MYNIHTKPKLSVHESWSEIKVAAAPHILTCSRCVLLEWEHDNLSAPYWRLYWNDRPGAYLLLAHKRINLDSGRVVLIPPHTVFGTGCDSKVGHFYVHFTLGLDRAVTPGTVFVHKPTAYEKRLIRSLATGVNADSAESGSLQMAFLVQILVNSALTAIPVDYWAGRLSDSRITQALRELETTDGGNAQLARAAGMNMNAFIRKFQQGTGHTPHQYRLRLRVERAEAALREDKLSIEEIAAANGFCDRFHFSRIFKQVMGVSPALYRRRSRGAKAR